MYGNIKNGELKITVVGLGYVGLPTALSFHKAGFHVTGIDVSENVINLLKKGDHHLKEEGSNLKIPLSSKKWRVTANYDDAIIGADLILITVPTPITKDRKPDLTYVSSACESILKRIKKGNSIIILESTVYPGVTRDILSKIGNKFGLVIGKDYQFAYSPERVSPGDLGKSSSEVAKIVGTDDKELGNWLAQIYSKITIGGSTYVGPPEVAEAAKLIENTQRDIDIAFANELAVVLPKMGLDVEDVLAAADTKWNFHRHTPGIGIGGHCIPVDPYFYIELTKNLGFESLMSNAARKMNKDIEKISAEQIIEIMIEFNVKDILFLGYSYKPNVGDVRETPVKKVAKIISESMKIKPIIWDPLVEKKDIPKWINYIDDLNQVPENSIIVIGTAHQSIINLDYEKLGNKLKKPIIYDGRRALIPENLEASGWTVYAIGRPQK